MLQLRLEGSPSWHRLRAKASARTTAVVPVTGASGGSLALEMGKAIDLSSAQSCSGGSKCLTT